MRLFYIKITIVNSSPATTYLIPENTNQNSKDLFAIVRDDFCVYTEIFYDYQRIVLFNDSDDYRSFLKIVELIEEDSIFNNREHKLFFDNYIITVLKGATSYHIIPSVGDLTCKGDPSDYFEFATLNHRLDIGMDSSWPIFVGLVAEIEKRFSVLRSSDTCRNEKEFVEIVEN